MTSALYINSPSLHHAYITHVQDFSWP
uniref:Uncharacterized protein n=1 Tax=Arundo donax TaxID=35708 RepID=A0A0A9F4I1_ARUDO